MKPLNSQQDVALCHAISNRPQAILLAFGFSLVMLFFGLTAGAQDVATAQLNTDGVIQLPADSEVQNMYQIDVSHMNFADDMDMIAFFRPYSCDLFTVRANPSSGVVALGLQLRGREDWTVQQWNSALNAKCAEKPLKQ